MEHLHFFSSQKIPRIYQACSFTNNKKDQEEEEDSSCIAFQTTKAFCNVACTTFSPCSMGTCISKGVGVGEETRSQANYCKKCSFQPSSLVH